jgi:hypothetical protein
VEPELERLELEPVGAGNDDFAIEHTPARELRLEGLDEIREVAIQRLLVTTLKEELAPVPEDQHPETVPLGLEDPARSFGDLADALGQHGQERRGYRKVHTASYASSPRPRSNAARMGAVDGEKEKMTGRSEDRKDSGDFAGGDAARSGPIEASLRGF